jgi:excisionase family DNA binding protein
MTQELERWYSLKEMTEHLGVSRETILIWISKRGMPASKVGRLWKFKKTEVDEWIKSGQAADK